MEKGSDHPLGGTTPVGENSVYHTATNNPEDVGINPADIGLDFSKVLPPPDLGFRPPLSQTHHIELKSTKSDVEGFKNDLVGAIQESKAETKAARNKRTRLIIGAVAAGVLVFGGTGLMIAGMITATVFCPPAAAIIVGGVIIPISAFFLTGAGAYLGAKVQQKWEKLGSSNIKELVNTGKTLEACQKHFDEEDGFAEFLQQFESPYKIEKIQDYLNAFNAQKDLEAAENRQIELEAKLNCLQLFNTVLDTSPLIVGPDDVENVKKDLLIARQGLKDLTLEGASEEKIKVAQATVSQLTREYHERLGQFEAQEIASPKDGNPPDLSVAINDVQKELSHHENLVYVNQLQVDRDLNQAHEPLTAKGSESKPDENYVSNLTEYLKPEFSINLHKTTPMQIPINPKNEDVYVFGNVEPVTLPKDLQAIRGKSQNYDFLSNLYLETITVDGVNYPSVEHYLLEQLARAQPTNEYMIGMAPQKGDYEGVLDMRKISSPRKARLYAMRRYGSLEFPGKEEALKKALFAKFVSKDGVTPTNAGLALLQTGDRKLYAGGSIPPEPKLWEKLIMDGSPMAIYGEGPEWGVYIDPTTRTIQGKNGLGMLMEDMRGWLRESNRIPPASQKLEDEDEIGAGSSHQQNFDASISLNSWLKGLAVMDSKDEIIKELKANRDKLKREKPRNEEQLKTVRSLIEKVADAASLEEAKTAIRLEITGKEKENS